MPQTKFKPLIEESPASKQTKLSYPYYKAEVGKNTAEEKARRKSTDGKDHMEPDIII